MRFRSVVALLLPVITFTAFSGCEIINPTEDTPSYLEINNFTLDPRKNTSETYGTPSNGISDAWVYANGKQIGVFELPAKIPILEKDSVKIEIMPGIYADGMKGVRFQYAFYTTLEKKIFLKPGEVTSISPVVKFSPKTVMPFPVYEEFTSVSGPKALKLATGSAYKLETNQDSLADFRFANGSVGVVYGNASSTRNIVLESFFNGNLPQNGSPVFLELDYRSTMPMRIGVSATVGGLSVPATDLHLNASREWKKAYVNLTDEVNSPGVRGATFSVLLEAIRTSNPRDYIAIDNVRLIHF
ncbi:hypothetical protein [Adhaeribacter soli]|uniref:DUF3823 domain-containing protein n=1 Tax=Adhaeribacter soli TaxID=2607655 RepID=A0A5N1IIT6_9BACT|nr:hypothetical protein [Adhaeribacter soli]KAA9325199.1 hypothetical protein F0P94_18410 [Adhaeribacter soli]